MAKRRKKAAKKKAARKKAPVKKPSASIRTASVRPVVKTASQTDPPKTTRAAVETKMILKKGPKTYSGSHNCKQKTSGGNPGSQTGGKGTA